MSSQDIDSLVLWLTMGRPRGELPILCGQSSETSPCFTQPTSKWSCKPHQKGKRPRTLSCRPERHFLDMVVRFKSVARIASSEDGKHEDAPRTTLNLCILIDVDYQDTRVRLRAGSFAHWLDSTCPALIAWKARRSSDVTHDSCLLASSRSCLSC